MRPWSGDPFRSELELLADALRQVVVLAKFVRLDSERPSAVLDGAVRTPPRCDRGQAIRSDLSSSSWLTLSGRSWYLRNSCALTPSVRPPCSTGPYEPRHDATVVRRSVPI